MDNDYKLALKLSKELNSLDNPSNHNNKRTKIERYKNYSEDDNEPDLNSTNNLVHPDWETIDPTPDIHAMFGAFDLKFFQGKLQCVTLEWSKRMYTCAGICYSRSNRMGMQCTIRLSEPLLKLRSRKNLIETLLHEMIHAYLFINRIREGNGGHGPNFKKMMEGINRAAGTNITVYHTFYDEVNLYKTHWWRCNGICQHRKPFFGYVKRTYNRAPGPNDLWWKAHLDSCSGTFEKVKQPEKPNANRKIPSTRKTKIKIDMPKGEIKANNVPDIRTFFPTKEISPTVNPSDQHKIPNISQRSNGNLSNVFSIRDLPSSDNDDTPSHSHTKVATIVPFTGQGRNLSDVPIVRSHDSNIKHTVRDLWSKRFSNTSSEPSTSNKRSRLIEENGDDDLILIEEKPTIVELLDSDEEVERIRTQHKQTNQTSQDRQNEILDDIKGSTDNYNDNEDDVIDLIDGDYDDSIVNDPTELIDKKVMDDLFGEDTLLNRYQTTATSRDSDLICLTLNNIIHCPLCQDRLSRNDLANHLEGCLGVKNEVKYVLPSKLPLHKNKRVIRQKAIEDGSINERQREHETTIQPDEAPLGMVCPVCNKPQQGDINEHLDICLGV